MGILRSVMSMLPTPMSEFLNKGDQSGSAAGGAAPKAEAEERARRVRAPHDFLS